MFNLMPKDAVFYDLFEGLSNHGVAVARHLLSLVQNYPNTTRETQNIREAEHKADDLAHNALERLDRTFITPFDREDIHTLVNELDDIVDNVDALAKRFHLYHVKSIEPAFIKQCEVLLQATTALNTAVHLLRKSRKLADLGAALIEVHRMENVGDDNNHSAISKLFDGSVEPLHVLRWKGLYDYIEDAIDGCEDVTNTLERIVLKNG